MDAVINRGDLNATQTVELTARRALYDGGAAKLYQSTFTPDENSIVTDFDAAEADFTGYAAGTLGMNAVAPDTDGGYVSISDSMFFQASDAVAPNTIGGVWFENSGGSLLSFYPFPSPIGVTGALNYISLLLALRAPGADELTVNS